MGILGYEQSNLSGYLGRRSRPLQSLPSIFSGGYYADFRDRTRLKQDVAGTTGAPNVNDPVGLVQAVGPISPWTWQQSVAGSRPLIYASGISFNGTAHRLEGDTTNLGLFKNVAGGTIAIRGMLTALAATYGIFGWSEGVTSNQSRLQISITSAGVISVAVRRIDGDTTQSFLSATGSIVVNTPFSIIATIDWATSGKFRGYLGLPIPLISGTYTGTPANTSNTASLRSRIGSNIGNTNFSPLRAAFVAAIPRVLTALEIEDALINMNAIPVT